MAYRYDLKKAVNVLSFLMHCLGGSADIRRLFLLMYFSDMMHLAKYGLSISGDTYMAMKSGPVPFHVLCIYRQLKDRIDEKNDTVKTKIRLERTDMQLLVAIAPYDPVALAGSEVECLFHIVHQYKDSPLESLLTKATGKAWRTANDQGEISLADMAAEYGASPEMLSYIDLSYEEELYSFTHYYENEPSQKRQALR